LIHERGRNLLSLLQSCLNPRISGTIQSLHRFVGSFSFRKAPGKFQNFCRIATLFIRDENTGVRLFQIFLYGFRHTVILPRQSWSSSSKSSISFSSWSKIFLAVPGLRAVE